MISKIIRILLLLILVLLVIPIGYHKVYRTIHLKDFKENIIVTCYNPVIGQCDYTPDITASAAKINLDDPLGHRWVAVSRDLKKKLKYGDRIYIQGTGIYDGIWTVQDIMNKRFSNSVDLLVGRNDSVDKWKGVKIYKILY